MEEQEINWVVISLFALVVGLGAIWLLKKNRRDKKRLQQQLDHERKTPLPTGHDASDADTGNE
ncbi:MAG TPA: hypothetical protein VLL95_08750 [Phnomibacter sp.]|nr:hypothetical protein [Phnomibacter sp.]